MGFWNDGIRTRSRSGSRSRSSSPSRRKSHVSTSSHHTTRRPSEQQHHRSSRADSTHSAGSKPHYTSRPSFARSVSSFISTGGASQHSNSHSRSRSYTSPQPRRGFVAKIRRFLRKIYESMRRHPVRVFFLVIMPLITGGVLTKLLAAVGVRLPRGVENMMGSSMARGQGERFYARGGARDFGSGSALGGMLGGGGMGEAVQGALSIAKMFM